MSDKQASSATLAQRASKKLREQYPNEYRTLLAAEYANEGRTYRTRLSAQERGALVTERRRNEAKAKIAALAAQYGDGIVDEALAAS
jgi:hypothetical protein